MLTNLLGIGNLMPIVRETLGDVFNRFAIVNRESFTDYIARLGSAFGGALGIRAGLASRFFVLDSSSCRIRIRP